MTNAKSFVLGALAAVAFLGLAAFQLPVDPAEAELADFAITAERSDDGIRMTCAKGCAWTELTWAAPANTPQAVDEYGMTDGEAEE